MKRQTFNEINITPLTDIFLVLLIIMMVIAPMLDQQGLSLAIPDYVEKTNNTPKENKILTIAVSEDDRYYFNGAEIPAASLRDEIRARSKEMPDGLLIEANSNSNHGAVVRLMDEARNAGVKSISITETE